MSIWNPTIGLMTIPYWKKKTYVGCTGFVRRALVDATGHFAHESPLVGMPWMKNCCGGWRFGARSWLFCIYIYISTSLYTQLDMYIRIFFIYISYIYIHIWQLYNINVHFIFCLSCNIYIYINRYIHIHYMNFMIACQISTTLVPLTM